MKLTQEILEALSALNSAVLKQRPSAAKVGDVVTHNPVDSAGIKTFVVTTEDPTPAKLDELIAAQKRTNELLEALLRIAEFELDVRRARSLLCTAL